MSRLLGIDIRPTVVRAALLRTSYRRVQVEALNEVQRSHFPNLEEAVTFVAEQFAQHHEAIGVSLEGHQVFLHRLTLPPAALKQVDQVLAFELEAQIPVDFDELVYDARVLPRAKGDAGVEVLAAAARSKDVSALITVIARALGHEPERVLVGAAALGNLSHLVPALGSKTTAIIDLGDEASDIAILDGGVTSFARTLSIGVGGLPAAANQIMSSIKQTLGAWSAISENPVQSVVVCGAGADLAGMEAWLSAHVGVEVSLLTGFELDQPKEEHKHLLPRYAKAIAVALGLRAGSKDLDLRRGALAYQRGYGFVKEKVPLLLGLGAMTLVSFVFSAWAESRALTAENAILTTSMANMAKQALGEETDDPARVIELLDKVSAKEKDPQPEKDAFDLVVALAEHIPKEIEHDVDDMEFAKNHVKLTGIVPTTEDAQKIAEVFKQAPCFKNVNISKIAQVVGKDRQKYSMEFDYRCEEDKPIKKESEEDEDSAEEEKE
jgi:general secretion pathway protein L